MSIKNIFDTVKKNKLARQLSMALAGLTAAGSLWLGAVPAASAMPEIMPVAELTSGMTGEAYTVVDGSGEIQSFDVEIVGVMGTGRGTRRMILARASGPVVEAAGGTLQGMSGSPVYINGQLVGALAIHFREMDPYTFMITPIEDMLEIWSMPDPKAVRNNKTIDIKKAAEEKEKAAKARERREKLRKERRAKANGEAAKDEKKKDKAADEKADEGIVGDLPKDMRAGKKPEAAQPAVKDEKHPDGYVKAEEVPPPTVESEDGEEKKPQFAGLRRKLFISGFDGAAAGILARRLGPLGYDLEPFMGVALAGGGLIGVQPAEPEKPKADAADVAEPETKSDAVKEEKPAEETKKPAEEPKKPETTEKNETAEKPADKKDEKSAGKSAGEKKSAKKDKKDKNSKKAKKDDKQSKEKSEGKSEKKVNILDKVELKPGDDKAKTAEGKTEELPEVWESSGPVAIDYDATVEPGSAIGVAAVYGDFTIGATGTVTAVDGKKVLAFGHSFAHKGNTNFFLTGADVVGTVSGPTEGMKMANVGNIIGRVNQDRGCGISGILGVYPSTVPIKLKVVDTSLNRKMYFSAQSAYDEDILPAVSAAIPVAAIARVCDSTGPATVSVKFKVKSNIFAAEAPIDAPPEEKSLDIERSNMFYCVDDGGLSAFSELNNIITLITANRDEESDIYGIDVEITTEAKRRTARLISATPSKPEVKPGEEIVFRTVVKPYRGEKFTVEVPYKIPEARADGKFYIDLHGGGLVPISKVLESAMAAMEDKETTADKVRRVLQTYSNNHIVAEPAAVPPVMSEKEQKKEIRKAIKRSEELERKRREMAEKGETIEPEPMPEPTETDYIIENFVQTSVMVKS